MNNPQRTKMKKIKSILIEGSGWIHSDSEGEIVKIQKNGEMALVDWYMKETKHGTYEYNGKYVIEVFYDKD